MPPYNLTATEIANRWDEYSAEKQKGWEKLTNDFREAFLSEFIKQIEKIYMEDKMSHEFICKNCGNDCEKNRVGFLYSDNEIKNCAACTDILAMQEQLEFDFMKEQPNGPSAPLDI